jgi:ABC-type branched-subunit amino acid transport system ATPase component
MRSTEAPAPEALLRIRDLDVYYGRAHALQGVSLSLDTGVLAVVGRNGMGKSTLCRAITGMVPARGSVSFAGRELLGLPPNEITRLGVAYVPQGRRVWRSLTVDETLRLAARTARQGAWTVDRVYQVFPRLAERRANGGAQLSGGEQQMLAIARALLFNPRLLVMDEPTEGLAPVIVEQVATLLKSLAAERSMSVLLIEQNLGVALEVADEVAVMVNGRIAHQLPAAQLAADRELQQRLLGLRTGAAAVDEPPLEAGVVPASIVVQRVVRTFGGNDVRHEDRQDGHAAVRPIEYTPREETPAIYLAGDWEAQHAELGWARTHLERLGARVRSVDFSGSPLARADIGLRDLQRARPLDAPAGLPLAEAFGQFMAVRRNVQGLLAIARGAGTEAAWAGALALQPGVPKLVLADTIRELQSDALVMGLPGRDGEIVNEAALAQASAALVAIAGRKAASRQKTARGAAPTGTGPRYSLEQTS